MLLIKSTYCIITVYIGTSNKKLAITGTHQTATFIVVTMNLKPHQFKSIK